MTYSQNGLEIYGHKINLIYLMSRTKRKDYYIEAEGKRPDMVLNGEAYSLNLSKKEKAKAQRDKKKHYKPNKNWKKAEGRKDKAKPKQKLKEAFVHGDDFDGVILPDAKKHHEWDYN